ncbi:MAG: hypothetical protein RLZZ53_2692, partial [Acidobacteriota bacterium]
MMRALLIAMLVAAGLVAAPGAQVAAVPERSVDEIFARWSQATPGCAVGVSVGGTPVLQKAYGMAD